MKERLKKTLGKITEYEPNFSSAMNIKKVDPIQKTEKEESLQRIGYLEKVSDFIDK